MKGKKLYYIMVVIVVFLGLVGAYRLLSKEGKIAFIGFEGSYLMMLDEASKETGVRITSVPIQKIVEGYLGAYNVIFLNIHGLNITDEIASVLEKVKGKGIKIVALGARDDPVQQISNVDVEKDYPELYKYLDYGGIENFKRFLIYSAVKFCNVARKIEEPLPTPSDGIYHPDAEDVFTSYKKYKEWYELVGKYRSDAPTVAITGNFGWKTGETASTDYMIRLFEEKGVNVVAIFGFTKRLQMISKAQVDAIVTKAHGRWYNGDKGTEFLEQNDIPLIYSTWLSEDIEEWQKSSKPANRMLAMNVSVPELDGAVEPIAIEGQSRNSKGYFVRSPIPERIERVVERTLGWIRLKKTPNAQKRVAIVYYAGPGKGDIGGGGLDVYQSLENFLKHMKEKGYQITSIPDKDDLKELINSSGRNVGSWAPGEIEKLVNDGRAILLPLEQYKRWFKEELSSTNQERVLQAHGEPPGQGMVYTKEGKSYFIIPQIPLGNVVLLPQPGKGGDEDDETIYGSDAIPPPHQYLAVYLWLGRGFQAHGLVHYGTHGNLEFLPGKSAVLSGDDWSDLLLGKMPNVYIYIMDDVGEALTAKRRSYAAIISYLTPPLVDSDIYGDLKILQGLIHKYKGEDVYEALKVEYRKDITDKVKELRLDLDLGMNVGSALMSDEQIKTLDSYLHRLAQEKIPKGLHIHGKVPETKELLPIINGMLGEEFHDELAKVLPIEKTIDEETRAEILKEKGEQLLTYVFIDGLTKESALKKIASSDITHVSTEEGGKE